ncbi:MAG: MFS transporter [Acidobacteria bacterium]|nr:MFS transporter [Acidobacteriota bacterium]
MEPAAQPGASTTQDPPKRDPYAALRVRDFRLFLVGHLLSVLGVQMQNMAVGWQLYEQTGSMWALANVGLVQIIPMLGLALPAGHTADQYDRRKVLMSATTLALASSLGLASVTALNGRPGWIYAFLFLSGIARAFQGPARSSLMPQLLPREYFSNSVSWTISGFELSSLLGPTLGGALIAWWGGAKYIFVLSACGSAFYLMMLACLRKRAFVADTNTGKERMSWESLLAGFRYAWRTKTLLAAMSLDMFAVLFGGAVALLPVYAKDILHVTPRELGIMQAAPSLGAVTMAFITTHAPPFKRAGRVLLLAVAAFGVATIVFGFSRSLPLSLVMLFLTGAFDNISVVIRHTLATLLTPDEMRGRVSAVNGMFINISNELGRFESGAVAALAGPVFSVVSGGGGTLLVVTIIALTAPGLRKYGRLSSAEPAS